jgi:hypothetical protein
LRIPSEGREETESVGRGMTETSPNPVGVALRPGRGWIFQRRKQLTVTSVKALGYDVVVACQMSPAVAAGVHLRTVEVHHGVVLR